jgi:hypothetical protein
MGPAGAAAFDAAVREALEELCRQGAIERRHGRLQLAVEATVIWGTPLAPPDGNTAVMVAAPDAL